MLCRKPFVKGAQSHGCGQCLPCRIQRRRIWVHRMMLEAAVHPAASVVSLTYDNDNLPDAGSLDPRHLQLFLKRVRKNIGQCRFYGVGEYGDETERPHYHVVLFGLDAGTVDDHVSRCWDYGGTYTDTLTLEGAQYVAGYVTKKLTDKNDVRLGGRYPEFARMSLRPGIGAPAIKQVAHALSNKAGWDEISKLDDVPSMLRNGAKTMPLGRYMRTHLRQAMNFRELTESDEAAFRKHQKMLDVYRSYLSDEEASSPLTFHFGKRRYEEAQKKKQDNMEYKMKMHSRSKKL